MDGIFGNGLYNYLCGAVAATEAFWCIRVRTQAFSTRWAWCFCWVAAHGRRPNHCFTRCNRTNKTARGSGLGRFGFDGAQTRAGPTRRLHISKQALRHASRAVPCRFVMDLGLEPPSCFLLNSDLKSTQPRIDKTQSPSSLDHLRVLCGRRRSSNFAARRRSRDKQGPKRRYSCYSLCLTPLWPHR